MPELFPLTTLTINEITQLSGIVMGAGQSRASDKPSAIVRLERQLKDKIGEEAAKTLLDQSIFTTDSFDEVKARFEKALNLDKPKPRIKKEKVPGERLTRGKKSVYAGKTIYATNTDNPRRAGTNGHRSYTILLNSPHGITYEDYIKAGGRPNDLGWDVERGWAAVK
jgi:hypothetical protein